MPHTTTEKRRLSPDEPTLFSQSFRIYLDDTDAGGIVYHANHLKLFERCRRDWLRHLGVNSYFYQKQSGEASIIPHEHDPSADIQFVVSDAKIKYLKPILLDYLVDVSIHSVIAKSASLILEQAIWLNNENDPSQEKQLLTFANTTLACVATSKDSQGRTQVRPAPLPQLFVDLCNQPTL